MPVTTARDIDGIMDHASLPPMETDLCGEKGIEAGALTPNSETLFARELCDLVVRSEVAILGYGKKIACIFAEKTSRDKILRGKKKKTSTTRKEFQLFDG
jgi:hypothetical protein